MRKFTTSVEASLRQVGVSEKQQIAASQSLQRQRSAALISQFKTEEREAARTANTRLREEARAVRQRIAEESRAAREVARITAETARQATAQDRIRERAAKALADVQVREARRAARELERSLATRPGGGAAGGNLLGSIGSIAGGIPGVGNLATQFNSVSSAATAAGGSVAAFAAPIAAASVAVGGLTIGLGLLARHIFETAKEAAAFQGKFFDLSQQVGVAVETLSTLDVIASTTGGNIETVTASMGIFQKALENAHDPTTEEAKLLKQLGVTSLDTEVALRQTLTGLFKMGEGAKQTDSVLQLFGRSGRFVNAILKESQGDLDAATKKFSEMGLIVSTEAAAAADQFNDSLEILTREIAAVTRGLVSDTIPVFTVFFQQINQGLTGNKDDWSSWSDVIKVEVAAALGAVQGFAQFVASQGNIPLGIAIDANIRTLLDEANKLANKTRFEADAERFRRLAAAIQAGKPGDRPDAGKGSSEAQARANKSIQLQQQALEESTRAHRAQLERERQLDLKSIDEWETESKRIAIKHNTEQSRILDEELANAQKFIKNRAELLLAETAIQQKRIKLQNETLESLQKIEDEAQRRRAQSELALNQQLVAIRDAEREGELKKIRQDVEARFITQSAAIQREIALLQQAFADRQILRDLELKQITTSAERKIQLDNEKIESERRLTDEVKRLTRERIRALIEEGGAQTPPPTEGKKPETPKDGNILTPEDLEKLGPVPPPPDFSPWRDAIRQVKEELRDFGQFASSAIRDGVLGIADALAQGVEAWALYGESIGKAMKKALAASLARVAGEATFQGALHAAWAIGSLAFGDFSGAAKHGIAAAKFFAVAAATGLAARAIAGNTFRQDSAGSGGGGGGGSQGPQQLNPITLGRNQPQATRTIVLQIQTNDSHIVKVVGADIRSAGQLRELILNDESI